jgi:ABC-2 type transport system permease protein
MLDATPGLALEGAPDQLEAESRIRRGSSYGIVIIPAGFERDVALGRAPRVTVFYNAQYLVPASTIRRDALAAVSTLAAQAETGARLAQGQHPARAAAQLEPIVVDVHTFGNPALSYVPYLVTGALPALLQIFVMVMAVHAFGSELKDGTAGAWLDAAGGWAWKAIAGKALPYALGGILLGAGMLALIFGPLEVPVRGNFAVIAGATALFSLAYLAMGFAAVAVTGNLRLATSLAAFYSVPAFAFAGLTFPAAGMPVLGRAWGSLLPLTHYLQLVVDQALRAAPPAVDTQPLQALLAFAGVPWVALGWRMAAVARTPAAWGKR